MPPPIGIDVSSFEFVDWQRVANAGIALGIAKVFQHVADSAFARNWEQIRNAGLLRGAYSFLGGPNIAIPTIARRSPKQPGPEPPRVPGHSAELHGPEGLTFDDLAFLARATATADDATIEAIRQAHADTVHPAALDTKLRALYQALFSALRFYDTAIDADVHGTVQQVPDMSCPPAALEES